MAPIFVVLRDSNTPQVPPHTPPTGNIYYVSRHSLNAVIWIGTVLAAGFFILRTKLQYSHNERFYINDYLIASAMLVHILLSVLNTLVLPSMYEMEPILAGLETPKPSMFPNFEYNLRLQFTILITWWLGLWLVKLAVLAFFWRLFNSVRTRARLFWWFMFGITISTFVISVFLFAFTCQPLGSFYHFGGCSTPANVSRAVRSFHFSSITDIITDFFIMLTPFPLLWKLQINRHQKAVLLIIFLMPVFVMIFAILRLAETNPVVGTVDPIRLTVFSTVETTCSMIAACLPSIRLFFINKKGKPLRDYCVYGNQKRGIPQGRSNLLGDSGHEFSNCTAALQARGPSASSSERVLVQPEDIHVRKDIIVHGIGQ